MKNRSRLDIPIRSGVLALPLGLLAGFALLGFLRQTWNIAFLIVAGTIILLERRAERGMAEPATKDLTRRRTLFALAVLTAVTVFIYSPTLRMYFLADDFAYVQLYSHPSLEKFVNLLSMDQSQGIWGFQTQEFRPLGGLSYMTDYWLFGTNHVGYHITAVSFHVISAIAVFGIARATALSPWSAAFAGLLFGVLPTHSESVAWINGSKVEALPSMFYLLGFLGFVWSRTTGSSRYLLLAYGGFLGSLMSKEIAVTFPAMLLSYDIFRWIVSARDTPTIELDLVKRWRTIVIPYVWVVVILAAYLKLRAEIFGNFLKESDWSFSIGKAFASVPDFRTQFGAMWTQFTSLQAYNAGLFLGFPAVAIGIALGVIVAWIVFLIQHKTTSRNAIIWTLYFAGIWYLVACLPLLITYHSPRHLYLPAAGPCIAVAWLAAPGWSVISRRTRFTRMASAVALLTISGLLLWKQNSNWVRSGEISAKIENDLPAALEATPKEALVIAIFPLDHNGALLWDWVTPFVLQEPFVSRNVYSEVRMLEFPETYCCGVQHWWEQKRLMLASVLSGDPEAQVEVHRLAWDENKGAVGRLHVTVPRKELHALIEGIVGKPESADTISPDAANKLVWQLMELTAQGK